MNENAIRANSLRPLIKGLGNSILRTQSQLITERQRVIPNHTEIARLEEKLSSDTNRRGEYQKERRTLLINVTFE